MTSEHATFIPQEIIKSKPNYTAQVNKDLVGEPLNIGIYDEETGKHVEPLTTEEIAALYKALEASNTAITKVATTLGEKVTAANEEHSEISEKYTALVEAQKTELTTIKKEYDEQQHTLTRESNLIFSGRQNAVSVTLSVLEAKFDAEIVADSKK